MQIKMFAAALTLVSTSAFAHSPVEETMPSNGATLSQDPQQLTISFVHDMRLTKVQWTHAGKHTGDVDLSAFKGFETNFALPFEGLGAGEYVIEWRGLSSDGHIANGSFNFVVEK